MIFNLQSKDKQHDGMVVCQWAYIRIPELNYITKKWRLDIICFWEMSRQGNGLLQLSHSLWIIEAPGQGCQQLHLKDSISSPSLSLKALRFFAAMEKQLEYFSGHVCDFPIEHFLL